MQLPSALNIGHADDFDFEFLADVLKSRLKDYQLSIDEICAGRFEIDMSHAQAISSMQVNSEAVANYQKLLTELLDWPPHPLWPELVAKINRFLRIWIQVYEDTIEFNIGLLLSGVIHFKTDAESDVSENFHLFFMGLVAEATNQFNQYRLSYVESHDPHSGLPNAKLMRQHLANIISTEKTDSYLPLGLMIVSFKISSTVTDGYHTTDPELIAEIAKLIQQNLSGKFSLYQVDIAEFAIVIPKLNDSITLDLLAAKLQRAFELTIHINNKPCALAPKIACVYRKTAIHSVDELYLQAKRTLEDVIISGKQVATYTPELDQRALDYAVLERSVLDAFESGRFELYLQPIIDLPEKICTYAELLLRCKNENGDFIPPPTVIDVIYKQGLGGRFLRWLLGTACRLGSEINHAIGYPVHLSLNLAANDLLDTEVPFLLSQSLDLWGLQGKYITLEITENGILQDEDLANKTINHLVSLGCSIALDDFGTGYSSMARLRTMPIDLVKIDQSFIRDIYRENKDFEIVRAIILLAHSLGKTVVAEGVEDEQSLKVLKELFCRKIQGYYFSRPLSYPNFIQWIQEFQPNPL